MPDRASLNPAEPPTETPASGVSPAIWKDAVRRILARRLRGFTVFSAALVLAFGQVLSTWAQFAWASDVHSYVLLIPAVSVYLVWLRRHQGPMRVTHCPGLAFTFFLAGGLILIFYGLAQWKGWRPAPDNEVSLTTFSFVLFLTGGALLCFGSEVCRAFLFPLVFLVFMVPLPAGMTHALELFFQHTSSWVAYLFLKMAALPVFRTGTQFELPGITLEVARECSGIRSSLVLFLSSLVAGHLVLRSGWRRLLLALVVVPLGILRNGLRILVLALLCVHVNPDLIHSWIHHRGGPIFFLLSLVPFLLVLVLLKRGERAPPPPPQPA